MSERRLEAVAAAEAYYHRPGSWAEPPNFFNPYWRPRLRAIGQVEGAPPEIARRAASLPVPQLVTH